jgi:hypothetical protein
MYSNPGVSIVLLFITIAVLIKNIPIYTVVQLFNSILIGAINIQTNFSLLCLESLSVHYYLTCKYRRCLAIVP